MAEKPKNPFEKPASKPPVDSERPTDPVEKEQPPIAINAFDLREIGVGKQARVEFHADTTLGRVDAVTGIGGPASRYEHNEDTFAFFAKQNVLMGVVLDGVGGSKRGQLASRLGAGAALTEARAGRRLPEVFAAMDHDIREGSRGFNTATGAPEQGSAAAAGIEIFRLEDGTLDKVIGWSGDCRILTLNSGEVVPQGTSFPQNLASDLVESGQVMPWDYYNHPRNNILSGVLGKNIGRPPGFQRFEGKPGDKHILFSDGAGNYITDFEMAELSRWHAGPSLQKEIYDLVYRRVQMRTFEMRYDARTVIKKNPERGDNITIMVIE